MITAYHRFTVLTSFIATVLNLPSGQAAAPTAQDPIAVARSVLKADRQAVVEESLHLTPAEAEKFWPLYRQYRAEMDLVADGLVKLVKEYAGYYPNTPEGRAKGMLKELTNLEKKQASTRATYLKKCAQVLSPEKSLRFAQVENRLDLAVKLQLAAEIPLVPIEGRITGEGMGGVALAEGIPGGIVVKTYEWVATVALIDKPNRKLTLVSADGIKKTVKVGPEAINFEQIQLGDQLKVTATEEMIVQMGKPGEVANDQAAELVALAPKGAKPGGVMAGTARISATVTAIDQQQRTATLRFEDGSTKTFPVRDDIDLKQRKVGDLVVFRVTETLALEVSKP